MNSIFVGQGAVQGSKYFQTAPVGSLVATITRLLRHSCNLRDYFPPFLSSKQNILKNQWNWKRLFENICLSW